MVIRRIPGCSALVSAMLGIKSVAHILSFALLFEFSHVSRLAHERICYYLLEEFFSQPQRGYVGAWINESSDDRS